MDPSSIKPAAESMPLDVVFEDPWLIAVNKPAGLVVHPSYKNVTGTLLNGILAHRVLPATPGVVTRLDKGTSGLVLVALTSQVHRAVQRDGVNGDVKKEYFAVVYGVPNPRSGVIALPLARDVADRRRVVVAADGARCETRYEVVAQDGDMALVRCELVTGRTHQIRVHLAAQGWPIAGDPTYGRPHPSLTRQALHAWRLTLPHPLTRAPLVIEAPMAADIRAAFPSLPF
jgi:23S rRNA pseudouridine1911/1915/1917 synthase